MKDSGQTKIIEDAMKNLTGMVCQAHLLILAALKETSRAEELYRDCQEVVEEIQGFVAASGEMNEETSDDVGELIETANQFASTLSGYADQNAAEAQIILDRAMTASDIVQNLFKDVNRIKELVQQIQKNTENDQV